MDSQGKYWKHEDCFIASGSIIRLQYNEITDSKDTKQTSNEKEADMSNESNPLPVSVEEAPVAQSEPITVEAAPDMADVSAAADAAASLGGDYAPLVGLALAAMAILGGKQAWAFYKERNERNHELEMTKLKMQAHDPNSRPRPCKNAQLDIDKRFEELENKINRMERKSLSLDTEEVEDMMRKVRKLERAMRESDD